MKRLSFLLPLFLLTGCSKVCGAVGNLIGTFVGDEEGDIAVDVVESEDPGMADLTVTLTTADGTNAFGAAQITCDNGEFNVILQTPDVDNLGSLAGTVADGSGSGDWEFTTGESGTWSAEGVVAD